MNRLTRLTPVRILRDSQQVEGSGRLIEDLIYDVGMNNGDDTAYYLHRGFRVVAVEANPALAEQAAARFREPIRTGRLQILNVGIADHPGALDFWICETHSHLSSFDRSVVSREGRPHHAIQVLCETFDRILEIHGVPHFLKVDIEGNDYLCVEALSNKDLPRYVSVEAEGTTDLPERLHELGYTRFKYISQRTLLPWQIPPSKEEIRYRRWNPLIKSRSPLARAAHKVVGRERLKQWRAATRRRRDWKFPEGASGPFGEETPGRWLTLEELVQTHKHFRRRLEEQSFWADFHAKREG